jgi:hypothetical protein
MARGTECSRRSEISRKGDLTSHNTHDHTSTEPAYGNGDSYRSRHSGNTHSKPQQRRPRPYDGRPNGISKPNTHSKSSRKNNPSTRIKSLQKQLDRASTSTMPANILAEKERELSYLLAERGPPPSQLGKSESLSKAEYNKIVGRYHKIRFFERRKAERNLRRLRKAEERFEGGKVLEGEMMPTAEELRRAEVDLVYTLYAPLDQKYIAVFRKDLSEGWSSKRTGKHSEAQKTEEDGSIVTLNDATSGFRPAHWHTIADIVHPGRFRDGKTTSGEAKNEDSEVAEDATAIPQGNDSYSSVELTGTQLSALEALRDGKFSSSNGAAASGPNADNIVAHRTKKRQVTENGVGNGARPNGKSDQRPAWQTETDEAIDPMDADSSEDENEGGMNLQEPTKGRERAKKQSRGVYRMVQEDDDDGEQSDGDGGFFER